MLAPPLEGWRPVLRGILDLTLGGVQGGCSVRPDKHFGMLVLANYLHSTQFLQKCLYSCLFSLNVLNTIEKGLSLQTVTTSSTLRMSISWLKSQLESRKGSHIIS